MNEFSDLEAELKQLQPRAASPELATRLETALAQTSTATAGLLPRTSKTSRSWLTIGLGLATAAAAVVLFARVGFDRPEQPRQIALAKNFASPAASASAEPARGFEPDGLTRVVYNTRDEGLIFPQTAAQPVRRVRSRARETMQWTERGTGASLRVSYPTDEVELTPVSGQ
ncbi:MAG: hypothetical protein ABR526_10425 [Chthoniobacterales bacterium]